MCTISNPLVASWKRLASLSFLFALCFSLAAQNGCEDEAGNVYGPYEELVVSDDPCENFTQAARLASRMAAHRVVSEEEEPGIGRVVELRVEPGKPCWVGARGRHTQNSNNRRSNFKKHRNKHNSPKPGCSRRTSSRGRHHCRHTSLRTRPAHPHRPISKSREPRRTDSIRSQSNSASSSETK